MIANIKALIKACEDLGLEYSAIDKDSNVVAVHYSENQKPLYFVRAAMPFNDAGTVAVHEDKEFTYDLLKEVVRMPISHGYLDPNIEKKYKEYVSYTSYKEIAEDAVKRIGFPCVVKRTKGSQGNNVLLVNDIEEAEGAFRTVFNHESKHYDNVALAQEFIEADKEYRVIILDNNVELVYERSVHKEMRGTQGEYEKPEADLIDSDSGVLHEIKEFLKPIFEKVDLKWAGLDVAIDREGKYCLFEINTRPGFSEKYVVKANGLDPLVELYKKALRTFVLDSQ